MSETIDTRQTRIRQKSAERRERQRQETRKAILEAATEMFEREGYEGFSLRQVAESIGYTPTTIYLYFKDKDDLLFEVCRHGFEVFTRQLETAYRSTSDPLERLQALGEAYFEFGLSHPLHYEVMFMRRADWTLKAMQVSEGSKGSPSFEILARTVAEGMQAGLIRLGDPLQTANLIWSGMHGIVSLHLSMAKIMPFWQKPDTQRLIREYMAMIKKGLQP